MSEAAAIKGFASLVCAWSGQELGDRVPCAFLVDSADGSVRVAETLIVPANHAGAANLALFETRDAQKPVVVLSISSGNARAPDVWPGAHVQIEQPARGLSPTPRIAKSRETTEPSI